MRLILTGIIFWLGACLFAQTDNPYRTSDCRIRLGRVLRAEVTSAPVFITGYSNKKTEPSVKLPNAEVNSSIQDPATVAITVVPNPGRSLSLYDYQIEYRSKRYRCVGMLENWTSKPQLVEKMDESKIYTLYFVVPAPPAGEPQVPMTLIWTLNASDQPSAQPPKNSDFTCPDRRVISIVNRRGNDLTAPQTLLRQKDDYVKTLSGVELGQSALPAVSERLSFSGSNILNKNGQTIGSLVNGARRVSDGPSGSALNLANGYAQIESGKVFYGRATLGMDYTLVMWFKIPPAIRDQDASLYAHGSSDEGANSVNIKLYAGRLLVKINAKTVVSDNNAMSISAALVADNRWHMLAVTASRKEGQQLFLDGALQTTRTVTDETMSAASQPLILGLNSAYAPESQFRGMIDGISLYDERLNAAQIKEIYSSMSKNIRP